LAIQLKGYSDKLVREHWEALPILIINHQISSQRASVTIIIIIIIFLLQNKFSRTAFTD